MRQYTLLALAGLMVGTATARADQITYTFTGHVNGITDPGNLLTGHLAVGDLYQVSATAALNSPPQSFQTFNVPGGHATTGTYDVTVATQIGATLNTQAISHGLSITNAAGGSSIYVQTAPGSLANFPVVGGYSYAHLWGTGDLLTNSLSHLPLSFGNNGLTGYLFTTQTYDLGAFNSGLVGVNAEIDSVSVNIASVPEPSSITLGAIGMLGAMGLVCQAGRRREPWHHSPHRASPARLDATPQGCAAASRS